MEFMNVSGQAVARVAGFWKVGLGDIVVVHDELDLPFERLKLGAGGGPGGHNGVRSIIAALGDPDFARVRVGIGRPAPGRDPADWVLSDFSRAEAEQLPELRRTRRRRGRGDRQRRPDRRHEPLQRHEKVSKTEGGLRDRQPPFEQYHSLSVATRARRPEGDIMSTTGTEPPRASAAPRAAPQPQAAAHRLGPRHGGPQARVRDHLHPAPRQHQRRHRAR